MSIKRTRQDFEFANVDNSLATIANYLMLFSQTSTTPPPPPTYSASDADTDRVFQCKTCNRRFTSFQALGGHRASHKKPKITGPAQSSSENSTLSNEINTSYSSGHPKKKTKHECSICGAEFAMGQALGGHMRRHRAPLTDSPTELSLLWPPTMNHDKVAQKGMVVTAEDVESTLCLDLCL